MEEEARTPEDGKLTGPHYQKLPRHAVNSSSVGARRGAAGENANVPRHHFSVLHFVLITNKHLVCLSNIQFLFPGCHFCSC